MMQDTPERHPPDPTSGGSGPSVRGIALELLCRVEGGAYADRLLGSSRTTARLSALDRNLLQELVRGTLTWRGTIDHLLDAYLRLPLARLSPTLRNVLRLGVYQLRHLDRIPAYAAVAESVDLARGHDGHGAARLANAVLRGISETRRTVKYPDPQADPEGYLCVATSHPRWLVRRWLSRFGFDETERLCEANNLRSPITLRTNPLRTEVGLLRDDLASHGIHSEPSAILPDCLVVTEPGNLFETDAFHRGLFSVQGPGAGLVVRLLDPRPGERVLDVCSAPGGKATAAAEAMEDQGLVVALDLRPARLRTLAENVTRLALERVRPVVGDGRCPPVGGPFDRVLVDVPCSALGVLARYPEIRWRPEPDFAELSALQAELLAAAAECLCPSGVLVYSTCSLEPEETDGVVEAFLRRRRDFELEPASAVLDCGVAGSFLQTLPHEHGCDGAFAARLRRIPHPSSPDS